MEGVADLLLGLSTCLVAGACLRRAHRARPRAYIPADNLGSADTRTSPVRSLSRSR